MNLAAGKLPAESLDISKPTISYTIESGLHYLIYVIITFFNKKINNLSKFRYQFFFNGA